MGNIECSGCEGGKKMMCDAVTEMLGDIAKISSNAFDRSTDMYVSGVGIENVNQETLDTTFDINTSMHNDLKRKYVIQLGELGCSLDVSMMEQKFDKYRTTN